MKRHTLESMRYHRGILIDQIPVRGFPGLLFVAATFLVFLGGVPAARGFFLITTILGAAGAGILYWWRNQTRW